VKKSPKNVAEPISLPTITHNYYLGEKYQNIAPPMQVIFTKSSHRKQ
jgi:hypothetical protein